MSRREIMGVDHALEGACKTVVWCTRCNKEVDICELQVLNETRDRFDEYGHGRIEATGGHWRKVRVTCHGETFFSEKYFQPVDFLVLEKSQ